MTIPKANDGMKIRTVAKLLRSECRGEGRTQKTKSAKDLQVSEWQGQEEDRTIRGGQNRPGGKMRARSRADTGPVVQCGPSTSRKGNRSSTAAKLFLAVLPNGIRQHKKQTRKEQEETLRGRHRYGVRNKRNGEKNTEEQSKHKSTKEKRKRSKKEKPGN